MKKLLIISIIFTLCFATDWPAFRGTNQNSISEETDWNPKAIENPDNIIWRKNIGIGYSTVSTKDEMVYTVGNINNQDNLYCLDEKTGKVVWKYTYAYEAEKRFGGPRSTPLIQDGKVYHFSRQGEIFCLNAKTGKEIWKKSAETDFDFNIMNWGHCSSPVIYENILLMNIGEGGLAMDKKDGRLIWKSNEGIGGGYSSALLYDYKDAKSAIFFNQENAYSVNVKTGKLQWTFPWPTKYGNSSADPVIIDGKILLSQGYAMGCSLLDISGEKPKELWHSQEMSNHFGTSIYVNGFIYGPDGFAGRSKGKDMGELICLDPKSGNLVWKQPIGFNSILFSDNKLIILVESGELIITDISNNEYKEIAIATVLETSKQNPCWTMPVLSNGKIYCRNYSGDLVCIDVSK